AHGRELPLQEPGRDRHDDGREEGARSQQHHEPGQGAAPLSARYGPSHSRNGGSEMARIGFIGLGNMGLPMAGNLVKAGHQVLGFDLVTSNVEKAVARKVEKANGALDVVKDADCVITMLPAGKHVLDVWGGGLLSAAKPGTIFI